MFFEPALHNGEKEPLWPKILAIASYLLFWIILSAAGLGLMFALRTLIIELMIVAQLNPWAVRGFDRLAIFILGLAWFVGMMWIESYLRKGIVKKRLWRNIARVALIEVIIAAAALTIRFVITL